MDILKKGSKGENVKTLLNYLNTKGNYGLNIDGIFGLATENAVKDFLQKNKLTVDGIVGNQTWNLLKKSNTSDTSVDSNKILILIDNGHGYDTPGKMAPDKSYYEWEWTREIAKRIVNSLVNQGYNAKLLVPEKNDIKLSTRVNRVNDWCKKLGTKNVCLVSVHSNAAGNGDWYNARGWSAWTSKGNTQSDKLADCLYDAAETLLPTVLPELPIKKLIRTDLTDGDRDYESNFYIITRSNCASCLTENMFHDNKDDVIFLKSETGKEAITKLHVEGIKKYVNRYMK